MRLPIIILFVILAMTAIGFRHLPQLLCAFALGIGYGRTR